MTQQPMNSVRVTQMAMLGIKLIWLAKETWNYPTHGTFSEGREELLMRWKGIINEIDIMIKQGE